MKKLSPLLLVSMTVLAVGCDAQAPQSPDAATQAAPLQKKDQDMSELKPPSADSVLYFIYQRDGDGAVSYKVDGGATVSYWYGHAFDLNGKHYFTGFGSKNQGEGPEGDDGMMDAEHVAISQATFTRVEKEDRQEWSKPDTDGYVGEFGRMGRPEQIDDSRKAQSFTTGDGRYLLAVPTLDLVNGTDVRSFALLLFDPGNVDKLGFRQWGYVGSIPVSDDNSDACDGGEVMPCVASSGMLAFEQTGAGLPNLKVATKGTTIASPGKVRDLTSADAVVYTFDQEKQSYGK
ncbi:hypothetical protein SAMN05428982_0842 [Pseudoxanthomonas sp. CF385]|uniref:hypothetical protein n=1 Tax=Pseudoxanthomonas sp. CF385 TaxID=1881042 RepID=UPI0008843AE8|nr:hypothetical protein [Pseudoxanthomonas sp. CF385]SDQ36705.1 hypothetical protein SAMN05428982_0842 [Pseudoxanthomonas sp. CF385]